MCTHSAVCIVSTLTISTYLPSVYVSSGNAYELQPINCMYVWLSATTVHDTVQNPCNALSVTHSLQSKPNQTQVSMTRLLNMSHITSTYIPNFPLPNSLSVGLEYLCCDAVRSGGILQTVQRILLPPLSGSLTII